MFKPAEDRLVYSEMLCPPAGYRCEFAIGTTFSLDLEALIGVPLALFLSEEMSGNLCEKPMYILEGLRKGADKLAIFCEAGQIQAPSKANPVFSLLEGSVFEVALQNRRSFHPKLWLIKYTCKDKTPLFRVLVLSRNLTFDRSWDVAVELEGEPNGRKTLKNKPLIEFLEFLQRFSSAEKRKFIREMQADLEYVHFQTGLKQYTEFDFLPLGIHDKPVQGTYGLFDTFHDFLVVSPFLSRGTVEKLSREALQKSTITLITRKEELSKLTPELLKRIACYCLKEQVVHGEETIGESEATTEWQKQDIHAKLYFRKKNGDNLLYIGSANCSERGWADTTIAGNVEFMLRLKVEKYGFQIADIVDELFCRNGKDSDERNNPFERIEELPECEPLPELDLQQRLQKAVKDLCRGRTRAEVAETDGKYSITVFFTERNIDKEITLRIAALGGGNSTLVSTVCNLNRLSLLELSEFYVITAEQGGQNLKRVIKISTFGIPAERDNAVYKQVIRDRQAFLQYIAFLLADDYMLAAIEAEELQQNPLNHWASVRYDMPAVYESLLRTAAHFPEKIKEIGSLMQRFGDDDIVPPEFEQLIATFDKVYWGAHL